MKKNIIIISLIVLVVAWMGFTLMNNKKVIEKSKQVTDRSTIAVPVSVLNAMIGQADGKFILPAVVEPFNEADITVSAQGKLENLNFNLGTYVNKGQVLGNIDSKLKEINLKSINLQIEKLEKDFNRYKELFQANAVTEVNFIEIKYNYENARIQAEQVKQQISDGKIIAPISGVITKKNSESGEYVNPGAVIASVVDVSQLKASVIVNEKDVYKIKTGNAVNIICDIFPDQKFKGTVTFVSPKGDENHNYQVEISVANSKTAQLKAGTFVRVGFDVQENRNVLQIPKLALVEGMKNPYVFIAENNKAVARKIVTGRETGENVEVIDGIKEGEQIVINGQINISEGSTLDIVSKK